MKRLTVNWDDLEEAFDNNFYEFNYFFDLKSGAVLMVTAETQGLLEDLYQAHADPAGDELPLLADILAASGVPEREWAAIQEADFVEEHFGGGIIRVPPIESREAYRFMEDFIETVTDPILQERLWRAIAGRGAFRRFKDELFDYPAERERWFACRDARQRQVIRRWLNAVGVEPANEPPSRGLPE